MMDRKKSEQEAALDLATKGLSSGEAAKMAAKLGEAMGLAKDDIAIPDFNAKGGKA
jgi:hypothetical protein